MRRATGRWMIGVTLLVLCACGPEKQPSVWRAEEYASSRDERGPEIAGNFDAAEVRWRKELAANAWSDEQALGDAELPRDDPPRTAFDYGATANRSGEVTVDDASSDTQSDSADGGAWSSVKAGANTVGKAGFAVFSVGLTLGMMVAPYLLL